MAFSPKLLGKDEHILIHVRSHGKRLIPYVLAYCLTILLAASLMYSLPQSWQPFSIGVILVVTVLLSIPIVFIPWWRWHTTTYTMTNKRIITRQGIFTKQGHDIPLTQVDSVSYRRLGKNRPLAPGELTLVSSEGQTMVLHDVPSVESVYELLKNFLDARENG